MPNFLILPMICLTSGSKSEFTVYLNNIQNLDLLISLTKDYVVNSSGMLSKILKSFINP